MTSPAPGAGIGYSIDGTDYSNTTGVFTGLIPGTYTVTVNNGSCISLGASVTINAPPSAPAAPTVTVTDATCAVATGTITVTAPVPGTGIGYSIDGIDYSNTTGIFSGLTPGNYNVTVNNGTCISLGTAVTVNAAPAAPVAPVVSVTNPTCTVPTGTITVTSPAPATGISYSIDGINYTNTTGIFTGLTPGNYNVTVQGAPGCISTATPATVAAVPTAPVAPVATVTDATCTVGTGTITVTSPAPATGITYSIDGINYTNTTGIFTGVIPGNYSVTVQGAPGCISAATAVTVNAPPSAPAAPTASATDATCTVATGTITVTSPLPGTGITYSIDGVNYTNTSGIFTGVTPGTYNVTVNNGTCISLGATVIVNAAPSAPAAPIIAITNPTCILTTGTITVTTPIPGTGITYSIDGVDYSNTTGIFTSLTPGNYSVTVNNGTCISIPTPATIAAIPTAPVAPIAIATDATCTVATGTITVTSPAPATGISYSIDGTDYSNITGIFTGVIPGNYNVTIKNAGGCISAPASIAVGQSAQAPSLVITDPAATCASGGIDLTAASITAGSDAGLTVTYWTNSGATDQLTNPANVTIGGVYYIKATNAAGCSTIQPVNVSFNTAPTSIISGGATICAGSTKSLSVSFTGTAPFSFTYSDGVSTVTVNDIQTSTYQFTVSPTLTTTYTITNTSDAICSNPDDRTSATVTVLPPIQPIRYPDVVASANVPVQLTVQNLGIGTSYEWIPPAGLSDPFVFNPVFNYDRTTKYLIKITNSSGCSVTDTLLVKMKTEAPPLTSDLFVPKAWTPNGDGHNDKLYPLTVNIVSLKYFRIFNRWGQLMFETNVLGFGWDGMYNGQPQVSDVYTWTVEAVGIDGKDYIRSGNSLLLR